MFKNRDNKTVMAEDTLLSGKQRNLATKLNKKLKKAYFRRNLLEEIFLLFCLFFIFIRFLLFLLSSLYTLKMF